jgi:hypothetical protein
MKQTVWSPPAPLNCLGSVADENPERVRKLILNIGQVVDQALYARLLLL